jgi:hypothetical protein
MNGRNPTAPTSASAHVEARGGLLARLGVPSATPRPSRWRTGDRTRDRARECINALHLISVYCIEDQDAGSTLAAPLSGPKNGVHFIDPTAIRLRYADRVGTCASIKPGGEP